jgi:acyl-coenzyme A synthetase/AMP-(fatty) acid ligase
MRCCCGSTTSRWRAGRSVRLCISGGAAMPEAVMQAFEQRFEVPILEGDGPTECGPVTCVNPPAGPRKPRSVGPAAAGGRDAHRRPRTGAGCRRRARRGLRARAERHARLLEPARGDRGRFYGDWFRTGDLGWRDADGWFYLVDRIKDLIISNGMNVYPRVIEEVLLRHPGVAEAAVVGEPHPLHGEIPVAYVTPPRPARAGPGRAEGLVPPPARQATSCRGASSWSRPCRRTPPARSSSASCAAAASTSAGSLCLSDYRCEPLCSRWSRRDSGCRRSRRRHGRTAA